MEREIGDSKQLDFKPQVKLMKWDNEVNFSIRAKEDPEAVISNEDGKSKYITPKYEVHQYDIENGFEFEWVLKEKPESNVLTATIQTKGLKFYYQPELTQDEIEAGKKRPENVVGSYAVYHESKKDNQYETGKAFHIYRPKAIDSLGNETWCDLNIDELLTITIPQKFLNKASYPVVVDPTFGYTTKGASITTISESFGVPDYQYLIRAGVVYTPSENGNVQSISAYLSKVDPAPAEDITFKAVLNMESGSSHPQVAYTSSATVNSTTSSLYTFTANNESITSNTNYIIQLIPNLPALTVNSYTGVGINYDTVASRTSYSELYDGTPYTGGQYASPQNPWLSSSVSDTFQYSIYTTYTPIGWSIALV